MTIQAKSFVVRPEVGTRNGQKQSNVAELVEKELNNRLPALGDVKSVDVSPLAGALQDAVLVTVLFDGPEDKKTKK
jgi:hypothetical protein